MSNGFEKSVFLIPKSLKTMKNVHGKMNSDV